MAKFVFKLQALLNVKTQLEDSLKNEMGKAVQKLEYEKDVLKQIEAQREECIYQVHSKSSQGIAVGRLKEYSSYISLLKEKMDLQKENINIAQENVDKYREQLIKAMQERKMLEKLKEKKYLEFIKEQFAKEQQLVDEVVSFNYNTSLTGEKDG